MRLFGDRYSLCRSATKLLVRAELCVADDCGERPKRPRSIAKASREALERLGWVVAPTAEQRRRA